MDKKFNVARINKDKNFDGKFFFAVKTTGIFCRPSCPAPIAKEENVVYFNSIFEALENSFRPCLRCRPDVELDYYSSNTRGLLTVKKALKLIYDGYLNDHSVTDLSRKLDLSDRHLRKLFIDHLGVPPVKIARYHKALFAKKLLLLSGQRITDIAFASGFGSLRQFNTVFKEIFGKAPSMIKKEHGSQSGDCPGTALLLKYRPPFNFGQMLAFMRPRAIRGVEIITKTSYARTFRTRNSNGFFSVRDIPEQSALALDIHCSDIRCYMEIYNKVRRMSDLDTDFGPINQKFQSDQFLAKGMTDGHVPRLPIAFYPFEFAVRAILGQQISVKAATTLAARIADAAQIKTGSDFPQGLDYFFPDPSELLKTQLEGLGITRTRQDTIRNIARAVLEQKVSLNANQPFEDFKNDFSALKGIGDWTINYIAMRGLGMVDSFPADDLGIIKAVAGDGPRPSKKQIRALAENWRPYRAYAALCLWNIQL